MGQNKLIKSLGLADVFCISAGAMISSGIFILPGLAFAQIGPAVFMAYLLAGVCALIGTLATIELATAMPLAGGIYFYTGRSMGPLAGTVSGLLNWSAIALKSSFAIFGMSELMYQFLHWNPLVSGVILTLIFLVVNLIGTKEAAWMQIIMVVLLFGAMGLYVVMGFPELKLARFQPFFVEGKGYTALFAEAAFVFVAFGGLLDVASISEEVKNPRRNLPWGMIGAILAVILIYVLTLIVTVGVLDGSKLAGTLTPLADAASQYYGTPGLVVITIGALMAFITTANAGVMAASRFPYAMARDNLIPSLFFKTYGRKKMPIPALLVTGMVMVGVLFLPLEKLVTVASTVIMLSFILTNAAVIILRESGVQNYRPSFKLPFYPWTPIISMGIFALLIMELGLGAVQISLGIVLSGMVLYFIFGRKVKQEYAFILLIRRIIRRRVPSKNLERELRDIIRDRDGIVSDDFDRVVESASVLLVKEIPDFATLADKAVQMLKTADFYLPGELKNQLIEREQTSSTVLTPFVAIPHLTIEGSGRFELLIVKSADGIMFNRDAPAVKAIIFLFGSADLRNLHLRALAAIAQTIQHPMFEKYWNNASSPEQLRDLFLLAGRKRAD